MIETKGSSCTYGMCPIIRHHVLCREIRVVGNVMIEQDFWRMNKNTPGVFFLLIISEIIIDQSTENKHIERKRNEGKLSNQERRPHKRYGY